jgi:hypothetical protein
MRSRPDLTIQVERRICHLQKTVNVNTQSLRNKWITELDYLFDIATSIAKGKVDQQQVGDKLQFITPKERQMWAQVSANVGMVMGNLAKGFDETKFNEDLAGLERQIDEIKIIQRSMAEEACSEEERLASNGESAGN